MESSQDNERRTLQCREIPPNLLRRQPLMEHFEKFGTVTKVLINKEKGVAHVEFENHEQAVQARNLGTNYQGAVIQIIMRRASTGRSRTSSTESPATMAGRSRLFGKAIGSSLNPSGAHTAGPSARGGAAGSRGGAAGSRGGAASSRGLFRGAAVSRVGQVANLPITGNISSGEIFKSSNTSVQPASSESLERSTGGERAPVQAGLYDDLPPPDEWEEENRTAKQVRTMGPKWKTTASRSGASNPFVKVNPQNVAKSAAAAAKKSQPANQPVTVAAAARGKILFGKPTQSQSEAAVKKEKQGEKKTLFGKPVQTKTEPETSPNVFGLPQPVDSKTIFGKPIPASGEPSDSSVSGATHGGSSGVTQGGASGPFGKSVFGSSGADSKLLFGKPAADKVSGGVKAEGSSSIMKPSLFGKPQVKQSHSPAAGTSLFGRVSPAGQRAQPTPSAAAISLPFKKLQQRSPSPSVRPIRTADTKHEATEDVEFILPEVLMSLTQTVAHTVGERQAVLDKREKLMRQGVSKESDISKARATRGCCPDMCPERERYIREERRRVHVYEMVPGTESTGQPQIDHARAVKEYSRSSADQEEPLPLELRPAYTLVRTMQYLCNNIVDLGGEGAWGDWYDFMWNRTRAIRKDITQQHLASPVAVGLVERCVRFHIYCGARLVEEGPMSFDSKINNENLTKCLQTLKEMYADLLKGGVTCQNEAEFRSYVVLMNLNEGDTLREAQQLREQVRSSPMIKFALSAYAALSNRNYVKFFKLVRQGTFMSACILHRYFNQIRYEALKIIFRSYTAPNGKSSMSAGQLGKVLHIEEEGDELIEFLEHYGLHADAMSRDNFILPESQYKVSRSRTLVEAKLITSVGEAVYGEPLPPNVIKQPTTSFSAQGYFIGIVKPPPQDNVTEEISEPARDTSVKIPPLEQIPSGIVKDSLKNIILEQLSVETQKICVEVLNESRQLEVAIKLCTGDTAEQVVKSLLLDVCSEVIQEARDVKSAEDQAERMRIRNKLAAEHISGLIDRLVNQEARNICDSVFSGVQEELYRQRRDRCGDAVGNELIQRHLPILVREIADEVFLSDVTERRKELKRHEQQTKVIRCRRLYRKWRAVYQKRTHVRRCMLTFPAAPPLLPQKRNKDFNVTADRVQLGKRSRLSVGPPGDLNRTIEEGVARSKLRLMASNSPINMSTVIRSLIQSGVTTNSDYLKLIVLLPNQSSEEDKLLSDWLTMKLSTGAVPEQPQHTEGKLLSLYNIPIDKPGGSVQNYGVCMRSFLPSDLRESVVRIIAQPMIGANAAIFLLPYTVRPNEVYWSQNKRLLSHYMSTKPINPAIPLVIVNPLSIDENTVKSELGVDDFNYRTISDIRIDSIENTVEYSSQLVQSLGWLVKHTPSPPELEITDLKSYLETYLTKHFYSLVYQDQAARQSLGLLHMGIDGLIQFYNDCLSSLIDYLTQDQTEYSWPLHEHRARFGELLVMSDPECIGEIREILQGMMLSDYPDGPADQSWQEACSDLSDYIEKMIASHTSTYNSSQLITRIESLLEKTVSVFNSKCRSRFHRPPPLTPLRGNMPCTDILTACVDYILNTVSPVLQIMHKPIGDVDIQETDLPAVAPGLTYSETMELALLFTRKLEDQPTDDSYIDLESSIHNTPVAAIKLDKSLTDELNASKNFETYLELALNDELGSDSKPEAQLAKGSQLEDQTALGDISLAELIKKESEKSQAFEDILRAALDE